MTASRTCAGCALWSNEAPTIATGVRRATGSNPMIGVCRRNAPVVVSLAGMTSTLFPETYAACTCGEWQSLGGSGPDGGEKVVSSVISFNRQAA